MKSNVYVYLDKEDAVFTAGDVIKGRVQVVLTSDIKVKGEYKFNLFILDSKEDNIILSIFPSSCSMLCTK